VTTLNEIVAEINDALPNIKSGSLRFWGQWFGRPYDNWHRIVSCKTLDENALILTFSEEERLTIWEPGGVGCNAAHFRIENAKRVRWEWYYYGKPKLTTNLHISDYTRTDDKIVTFTTAEWYAAEREPSTTYPAVEIL
jgi:hypothetical protein